MGEGTQSQSGIGVPGVFVGQFTHALDPKKRLTIPAEWRERVGAPGSFYVLPGIRERCLYIYSAKDMIRRWERVRDHSIADTKAWQFMRTIGARSDLATWDTQGRIRIKDELLEYAHLVNDVVLVGVFERFELWSPDAWKAIRTVDDSALGDAARYVGF